MNDKYLALIFILICIKFGFTIIYIGSVHQSLCDEMQKLKHIIEEKKNDPNTNTVESPTER